MSTAVTNGLASTVPKSVPPPPLTSTVVVTKSVQLPPPLAPMQVDSSAALDDGITAGQGSNGAESNGHQGESNKKKRKRSSSDAEPKKKASKSKKQKTEKKRKQQDEEEVSGSDSDDDENVEMSKNELGEFVQSIMDITRSEHPETALVMVEQKLSLLDQLKTFFGLEIHSEDVKVLELINDAQLKAIYKGMVIGKLMLPMEEYQKDGAWGFVTHILDSQSAGKHLVPYALCCWDYEKSGNIQASIDDRKRAAAVNPQSKNFYLFNKDNEFKKALRRTKFWYAFGNQMAKEEEAGRINGSSFGWDQLKTYCEAFWCEEGYKFKKYYINVYVDKQSQLIDKPAWPIPMGAYQEGRDFILGVWPFVQIYFMSSLEGPVVLSQTKKTTSNNTNSNKPEFDFGSALKKLEEKKKQGPKPEAKRSEKESVKPGMMVIDHHDESDDESDSDDQQQQEREKKRKHTSKSKKHGKKSKLSRFTDSQAEEDDD